MKEKPKLMYNEKDIALLKSAFCENDELLVAVRLLFFGLDITDEQKKMITSTFSSQEMREVFMKKVYGIGNYNTPIGQVSDFWMGIEQQIFGASRDTIYQAVQSKALVLDMFQKCFVLLENPDAEKVSIEFNPNSSIDELQVKLIARNLFMKAIETALLTIKMIAGMKDESPEQAIERLSKDSTK